MLNAIWPDSFARALSELRARLTALEGCTALEPSLGGPALRRLGRDLGALADRIDRLLQPATGELGSGRRPRALSRFAVLLVEDDPAVLTSTGELLADHFELRLACDGQEALELLREGRPDVIVSDLRMPRLDGLALLDAVKRSEALRSIPFLILSGEAEVDTKVRAFESGVFDYLLKPVAPAELVARIRNALVRSQDLLRERRLQALDDLTGLANRRALARFLDQALQAAVRDRSELAVAIVDQDGLKEVNDTFGHAVGDRAICAVARAIERSKRADDVAARIGGDEFVVAMPATDRRGAQAFVDRVRSELARRSLKIRGGETLSLGVSCGLATCGDAGWPASWERMLQLADEELYAAKRSRRSVPALRRMGR